MAQHFEQPTESGDALRAQRMTADESRAVIALWQQERVALTGLTDQPALPDVAEGLDITVEDVQRLLQEVRAKRIEEEHALALEQARINARLAEGKRNLAVICGQQAEMKRVQAEPKWGAAELPTLPPTPSRYEPGDIMRGFLPGFVAIMFVVGMALLLTALAHPAPPMP